MPGQRILICAISGRALAQSARAAGFVPVVLDRFGDADARAAAAGCATIAPGADSPFSAGSLLGVATTIAPPPLPLVYGSGFDGAPELLGRLAEGRELLGNAPAEVERVKDPFAFATVCHRLGIPHPETAPGLPADRRGWLVKRRGGAGGSHVRDATTVAEAAPGDYGQRRVEGEAVSVLLLGDGRRCLSLALSRQWQRPQGRRHFSGTLFPAGVATGVDRSLREAAVAIEDGLLVELAAMRTDVAYAVVKARLERSGGRDFTAIQCCNDASAFGAMTAILEAGLRVPRDISIVGFDDIPTAAMTSCPLSTIRVDCEGLGANSVRRLVDRIRHRDALTTYTEYAVQLVARESTGPAAGV